MKQAISRQHLSQEINRFGEQWHLTPRERDVLQLIAFGTTRIKEVAADLKLSPNTVNNHVNSIFAKTQTRSKSELLTRLLSELTDEVIRHRLHRQSPRVLIHGVSTDAETMSSALHSRGCHPGVVTDPETILEFLGLEPVDFLLLDADSPSFDVLKFLDRLTEPPLSWTKTLVFAREETPDLRAAVMARGAIDLIVRPLDHERVYTRLMSHYTESPENLAQFEAEVLNAQAKGRLAVELCPATAGRGGVFLPSQELSRGIFVPVGVGDRLDLEIRLKGLEGTIEAPGQIVWLREKDAASLRAGAGVRLIPLRAHDRERLTRFSQNHRIRSYIPLGASAVEAIF